MKLEELEKHNDILYQAKRYATHFYLDEVRGQDYLDRLKQYVFYCTKIASDITYSTADAYIYKEDRDRLANTLLPIVADMYQSEPLIYYDTAEECYDCVCEITAPNNNQVSIRIIDTANGILEIKGQSEEEILECTKWENGDFPWDKIKEQMK
jgi:hypothetical protein